MTTTDAVLRLVSVGVVWMAVHCAGMCGPLLMGLDVAGASRGAGPLKGAARMLAYQGGRAVTYATLGGLAGLVGGGLAKVSSSLGAVLGVVLGVIALARAVQLLVPRRAKLGLVGIGRRDPDLVTRLMTWARPALLPVLASTSPWRPALLGAVLGFLPCMIALWALGLAAMTGSPLGGAAVMLSLVVMTTPLIVSLGVAMRFFSRLPAAVRVRLPSVLLGVSGLWLVLISLAGADVIPHAHVALGHGYMIMLF